MIITYLPKASIDLTKNEIFLYSKNYSSISRYNYWTFRIHSKSKMINMICIIVYNYYNSYEVLNIDLKEQFLFNYFLIKITSPVQYQL